jgi:hypothetical protein
LGRISLAVRTVYTFSASDPTAAISPRAPTHLDDAVHALRIPLDHDERHVLAEEFLGDDRTDSSETAHDEVLIELVEHALQAAAPKPFAQAALADHERRNQGERVGRRSDSDEQQQYRESLAGIGKRMHLPVPDRRHHNDGLIEGFPDSPSFYQPIADGAANEDQDEQQERERRALDPQRDETAARPHVSVAVPR